MRPMSLQTASLSLRQARVGDLLSTASLTALLALTMGLTAGPDLAIARESRAARKEAAPPPPLGPHIAVISVNEQTLKLHGQNGVVASTRISTGTPGHPTPFGIFSVLEKKREHYSNLYNDASMPFMQRVTWSGVAMHAGYVTGRPASHGCIRLPYAFAQSLFGMTKVNMRVLITTSPVTPQLFAHDKLFVPRRSVTEDAGLVPVLPQRDGSIAPEQPLLTRVSSPGGPAGAGDNGKNLHLSGPGPEAGIADQATRENAAKTAAERMKTLEADRRAAAERAREATKAADVVRKDARVAVATTTNLGKATGLADKNVKTAERAVVLAEKFEVSAANSNERVRDRAAQLKRAADERLAQARIKLQDAKTAEEAARQTHAAELKAVQDADDVKVSTTAAYRELARLGEPVSVFISGKTGLLQIRQAFDPIFETPVTITDRGTRPLGTHVFTAMDVTDGENGAAGRATWMVTTLPGEHGATSRGRRDDDDDDDDRASRRRRRTAAATPPPALVGDRPTAASVLDRIEIPTDVRDRISALLVPGSSLIISDEGPSIETGKGTDFVILAK